MSIFDISQAAGFPLEYPGAANVFPPAALAPGLYERLITNALKAELEALEREGTSVVHSSPIDPAEAHTTLARHIEGVVARALRGLPEKERNGPTAGSLRGLHVNLADRSV